MKTIKELKTFIKGEIKNYQETPLELNPSFTPRVPDVLDLIDLYSTSNFRDSDKDELGFKKPFYNIVNFPVDVAAKMLDIDTKHILLTGEDSASYWPSWLMTKELQFWMKDKYFGRELNKYTYLWPKYGHLFVKKVGDEVKVVPPQNIIHRVDALDINHTPIIEKHEYAPDEFEQVAKERNWDKKARDRIIDKMGDTIKIYEVYIPGDQDDNYFIICPAEEIKDNDALLGSDKRDIPYKELPWRKIPGRLLGRGRIEDLFEEQIYLNRIARYKSEGFHWTSKHWFQTRDATAPGNLLTEAANGDVFILNSELNPVVNEERNMHAYRDDEMRWQENAYKRSFTQEPITGGRAPAGTPLGSTVLQARLASGFYDQKKQDLAMFIKEILWDWVLPQFKNQKRKEHKVLMKNLLSDDEGSEKFFQIKLNERMRKLKAKTTKHLTPEQWKIRRAVNAEMLKGGEVKIPKSFYDSLKQKIDITIVGESLDTASKQSTLQVVFQILGTNPAILQDKRARRVFEKMLDYAGLNPKDILGTEEPQDLAQAAGEARAQQGGSIAAPVAPAPIPTTMPTETRA